LTIKASEREKDNKPPKPQYSLQSTLLHKRFSHKFRTLTEYSLLNLCTDADKKLRDLVKNSGEFIKANKELVF
jgi:hypothetical protein